MISKVTQTSFDIYMSERKEQLPQVNISLLAPGGQINMEKYMTCSAPKSPHLIWLLVEVFHLIHPTGHLGTVHSNLGVAFMLTASFVPATVSLILEGFSAWVWPVQKEESIHCLEASVIPM